MQGYRLVMVVGDSSAVGHLCNRFHRGVLSGVCGTEKEKSIKRQKRMDAPPQRGAERTGRAHQKTETIMTKDQQDLAWACLPKETRDQIRDIVKTSGMGIHGMFDLVFGGNVTSDTEPEEMLMVKREIIQEAYKHHLKYAKDDSDDQWHWGIIFILSGLFGDKCLLDKPNTPKSGELKPQMAENKPKFKVGDKVRIILCTHPEYRNKVGTTTLIDSCGNLYVKVDGLGTLFHAPYALEPYTEEKVPIVSAHDTKDETMNDTKETMEEKELNLCEQLKGCEKHKFYSPMLGDAFIVQIRETSIHIVPCDEGHSERFLFIDKCGIWIKGGQCILYPSRALYEKYPLDAKKAWDEWANERKPKRWTPQIGERFFFVNAAGTVSQDFCRSEIESNGMQLKRRAIGNEFQTGKDAEAFAKIFREALTKFHEENNE